ncbi:N-succinylarginine dihydrolase [Pseudoalteromonas peptidolytica]|uniref:N-succinylarginine dihydrolase n=1 Tax=Pseudoalteromonas peptidolytica TaxID=61150 RepID=UPI00298E1437|nr:N-succinylarginine dihydrolase [Pseudoalteromonas peptidolytica]MDW7550975.1 N-succinylarginine dihydrolase [Pseudoalteromonas peptidolytica]
MKTIEVNFDGLVGPSHNFSGLSSGNRASQFNKGRISNPKLAALQGLEKMKLLMDIGLTQGILPPQMRPDISMLRRFGFTGSEYHIIDKVSKIEPQLLSLCYSSSSMWAANSATISPSSDTSDGKLHITAANLASKFHRSLEVEGTELALKKIFKDSDKFVHHPALPPAELFKDEGAANQLRFCNEYGDAGLNVFVHNQCATVAENEGRQSRQAHESIRRLHQLNSDTTIHLMQNPEVVSKGFFHNDTIAVNNKNVFLYHEMAYIHHDELTTKIAEYFGGRSNFYPICVPSEVISLDLALKTYMFNSQLISINSEHMALIAPIECSMEPTVKQFLDSIITSDNPVKSIHYVDLRQSMLNGGGPACLRLRVQLTERELAAVHSGVILTPELYAQLRQWIEKYYRDQLRVEDLADPNLYVESCEALDNLSQILDLNSLYFFQQSEI